MKNKDVKRWERKGGEAKEREGKEMEGKGGTMRARLSYVLTTFLVS